ncbi:uncharacterized protein LOC131228679 [Magnolia sinica]|uniref:uncharacterized protein LOC131228679 n=1 Tax=Magnolia sinica TaxID=86752 RepID=UPI002658377F|nr:uncharacterized protein LOC131228679 [Magnolia sinica]
MFHLGRVPNGAISAISPPPLCIAHPKPHLFSHPNRPKFNPRKTLNPNLTIANAESRPSQTALSNPTSQSPPFPSDEIVSVEEDRVPLEGVIQIERPTSSSRFESWARVALLAGGDVLVLLLFAAIGRYNHGFPVLDLETLHTADPFIAGWFLAAYFLGGYGDDGKGINGSNKAIIATAKSWAVGIPLGLIIRVATSGHIPSSSFVLVSMGSTAVLLIGWRALLTSLLPNDQRTKNDVYRRGSPFELFELLTSLVRRW